MVSRHGCVFVQWIYQRRRFGLFDAQRAVVNPSSQLVRGAESAERSELGIAGILTILRDEPISVEAIHASSSSNR